MHSFLTTGLCWMSWTTFITVTKCKRYGCRPAPSCSPCKLRCTVPWMPDRPFHPSVQYGIIAEVKRQKMRGVVSALCANFAPLVQKTTTKVPVNTVLKVESSLCWQPASPHPSLHLWCDQHEKQKLNQHRAVFPPLVCFHFYILSVGHFVEFPQFFFLT